MAGNRNSLQVKSLPDPTGPLPITKNGYQFTNWGEYSEAKWLVKDGSYESLEEYGASITRLMEKVKRGSRKTKLLNK